MCQFLPHYYSSFFLLVPQVRNLIERRPKGQTVIAIAHRLSTIRSAGMWFISYILMVICHYDIVTWFTNKGWWSFDDNDLSGSIPSAWGTEGSMIGATLQV